MSTFNNATLLAVLRAKERGELGKHTKWRDPFALAALLRPSRKSRNAKAYTRKAKHRGKP